MNAWEWARSVLNPRVWAAIRDRWPTWARTLQELGLAQHQAQIEADPEAYRGRVNRFVETLQRTEARLLRLQGQVPREQWVAARRRWQNLAAGLFAEATPHRRDVGVAPAVFVVAGIAITVVGVSWAVVAYKQAQSLDKQTALAERELDARVRASEDGRVLQPNTLPEPPDDDAGVGKYVGMAIGTLLLLGGGYAVGKATGAFK